MIGERLLRDLRIAATLAHCLPLRVRVAHGGRVLVDVGRHPSALDPCGFRAATIKAWRDHRAGRAIGLCGLPVGVEPTVVVDGGVPGPCGLLEVEGVSVLATTLDEDRCRACCAADDVEVHADVDTGVCVVVGRDLDDVLARIAAEELASI